MTFFKTVLPLTGLLLMLNTGGFAVADDLSMVDARTVGAYPLTMDKVRRKFAAAADLARLTVTDPALQSQMQSVNEAKDLDGQIKALGAIPKAAATLQAHGISPRDYCLTTLAVGYAEIPQMPAQLRPANSPPDPGAAAAPPEHVQFVMAHRDEILKLTQAIVRARAEAQR